MSNSNNKQSNGLILNALGVAKKFSNTGLDLLNHVAPDSVAKVTHALDINEAIEGAAKTKSPFEAKKYNDPQQMLREYLPNVSQQLLGRHFSTINNAAHFISPQFSDKVTDYFFDKINQFTNELSSVDAVLDEAGARDLEELTNDVDRSGRIAHAFFEQNKWIATAQGAISGATGIVGTAIDIPVSLILSLRTIYQVGRAYGFDLSKEQDQEVVQYIFKQIDLGVIAEKQALLLALKTITSTLQTHDLKQLQGLVGSSNDLDSIKQYLTGADGQFKWQWLNSLPKISVLSHLVKLRPVAGAGIGAVYSWRLIEDVHAKALQVFSQARAYLLEHKDSHLSPIEAYEKVVARLAQASPLLLADLAKTPELDELKLDEAIQISNNVNMSAVKLVAKTEEQYQANSDQADHLVLQEQEGAEHKDEFDLVNKELEVDVVPKVSDGIAALAEQLVTTPNQVSVDLEEAVKTPVKVAKKKLSNTAEIELKPSQKKITRKASESVIDVEKNEDQTFEK
jgi:CHASE3 domain sensor protein